MKRRTFLGGLPGALTLCSAGSPARNINHPSAPTIYVGDTDYPDLTTALAGVLTLRKITPPDTPIVVRLPEGIDRVRTAVRITAAHGGANRAPLIIQGAGAGSTRIVGSSPIPTKGAKRGDFEGGPLPPGALTVQFDMETKPNLVPRGAYIKAPTALVQLYQGEARLSPSRWPVTGHFSAHSSGSSQRLSIELPAAHTLDLQNEPALWASGYWKADWAHELTPIMGMSADRRTFWIEHLHGPEQPRSQTRYCILNAFSALREPGTYALDPGRQVALILPLPSGGPVEEAVSRNAIHIENASNVIFKDISFDRTLGAAAVVVNSKNILFENCAFRQTGGNGVTVEGGLDVQFRRCVISETAETGLVLSGGDRETLRPAQHSFTDGIIANFGLESPTYHPAVWLMGVGQRLIGSLLTGGAHNAVMLSGNDHKVSGNEISDVLRETDDAGAIYMGADWSERGTSISNNYIHGLGGAFPTKFLCGIYLDDQASGLEVSGNIVIGGDYGIAIGGGRDNKIAENLLLAPKRGGIFFDARGLNWAKSNNAALAGKLASLPVKSAAWRTKYPSLAGMLQQDHGKPIDNVLSLNIASEGTSVIVATPPEAKSWLLLRENHSATIPLSAERLASYIRAASPTAFSPLADRAHALKSLRELAGLNAHQTK